jgi:hypothetical protein
MNLPRLPIRIKEFSTAVAGRRVVTADERLGGRARPATIEDKHRDRDFWY